MRSQAIGWAFLGLLTSLLVAGCGTGSVSTPTSYQTWNAQDGTFCIEYPAGWKADGGGKHGIQWATFRQGSAQIDVSVSFGESVVGDILGSGVGGGAATKLRVNESGHVVADDEDITPPVAIIHEKKRKEIEEDYSDYREKEAVELFTALGEGRKSEFKANKGLVQLHGYRATILNSNRGITVICHCAEKDWEKLQAPYDKILASLKRGTPQR